MTIKAFINAVKGEKWCRLLTVLMRLTVGGIFAFSGFTKGIDPWGTCYKITDYLTAMGLEQWTGAALFFAVGLTALEFMIGIALIVGVYRRSSPWIALIFMLVMTPLTLWIAVTGAVPDCGCFGDALHMSNWATFGKNVLLLLGVIYLLMFNRSVPSIYGPAVQWMVMAVSFALMMAISYYGYFKQPLIDYRPYPVGSRLVSTVSDNDEGEDDFIFIYRKDSVEQEFSIDSLPDEEDGWEYVTRYHARRPRGKVIVQYGNNQGGIAILDDEGNDVTINVMGDSHRMLMLLFPDMTEVGVVNSYALNELNDVAQVSGIDVVGLTPSSVDEIDQWQDMSMASYPIYNMDDSELKMVARGNPAVVYLEDGVIKWKRALTSFENIEQPMELSELGEDYDPDSILSRLMFVYIAAMLALLVVNRTHVLVRRIFTSKNKNTQENQ